MMRQIRAYLGEEGLCSKDRKVRGEAIFLLVFAAVSLVFFYSFIYNDILETMRCGISFWDALFGGNLRYFYAQTWSMDPVAYTKEVQAVYDFPIYIVFALWNFPLWIAEHFFSVDVFTSVPCLMWGKTLLLVGTGLLMWALWKLSAQLGMDARTCRLVCILFLTSNFYMTSVIMMSAYDILALYCALEGIRCWAQGSMKGFVIWFMCSIPLKFFSLLLFVPLLLMREKRTLRIAGYLVLSVLPIIVFRILIPCRAVAGDASSVAFSLLNAAKSTELSNLSIWYVLMYDEELVMDSVYPSVIAFLLVFLVCYIVDFEKLAAARCGERDAAAAAAGSGRFPEAEKGAAAGRKKKDSIGKNTSVSGTPSAEADAQLGHWGIYMCFLTYAVLFVTCFSHPYWLLIMLPFVCILVGLNREHLYVNVLIDTFMTWGMILAQMFRMSWCYGSGLVAGMFWPALLGRQEEYSSVTPLSVFQMVTGSDTGQSYAIAIGGSLFLAGILAFAVLNCPGRVGTAGPAVSKEKAEKKQYRGLLLIKRDGAALNWLMLVRVGSGFVIAMIPIVLYILGVRMG